MIELNFKQIQVSKYLFQLRNKGDGGLCDATCFAVKQKILSGNRGEG